jgi:hypothetical protein
MSRDPTITLFAGRADGAGRAPSSWLGPEILVTLFWLLALSATLAYGATVANLTLTGTVPLSLNISVAPRPAASNLDLTVTQPALRVADVTVVTNNAAGYQVTVRSGNVANGDCTTPCFYSTTTTDSLGFTFYRDGVPIGFTGDTGTFVQTAGASGIGGEAYAADVSYDGAATLLGAATNYGEALTFTVSIN